MENPFSVDITGVGVYEPKSEWSNQKLIDTFAKFWYKTDRKGNRTKIDSSDEWIKNNVGIETRFFAEEESNLEMAVEASRRAVKDAGLQPEDIDTIYLATNTHPDNREYPSLGFQVQAEGYGKAPQEATYLKDRAHSPAPDIQAGCAGLVYGVIMAYNDLLASQFNGQRKKKNALVIGSEKLSDMLDFSDRDTCILLGDGATALVLQIDDYSGPEDKRPGIIATYSAGIGDRNTDILWEEPKQGINLKGEMVYKNFFQMAGGTVLKFGSKKGAEATEILCDIAQKKIEEISLHTPHSANQRIIDNISRLLKVPKEKFYMTLPRNGNTSVVATGLNLHSAREERRIAQDDLVSVVAFGAGLSYAGYLFRASERFIRR